MADPSITGLDPAIGTPIRVVVADDQTAIREALATVLDLRPDFSVVATAGDGAQAVSAAAEHRPDVVLMDLDMPGTGGVAATAAISEQFPEIAVVVLTTFADEDSILAALAAGARGYLTKESGRAEIARAITAAAAGQAVLDPAVQARLVAAATKTAARAVPSAPEPAPAPLAADLTPREIEVLGLIGQGLPNRAIARELFVSEATVKTHINNLFAKAQLRDRAHAVNYALTHGLGR